MSVAFLFRPVLFIVTVFSFFTVFLAPAGSAAQSATSTVLSVASACPQQGCVTTLTASVTSAGAAVHLGLVVFCDKGPANCENEAPIGHAQLLSNGTATLRVQLTPGPHSLRAIFHGTRNYGGSASSGHTLTTTPSAAQAATRVGGTANPSGNGFTFAAILQSLGTLKPTGTVSFRDASRNNALLTTAPVVLDSNYQPYLAYQDGNPLDLSRIPAALKTTAVAATTGDFNNDGFQDIAETDSNATLNILLGNGAGAFTAAPAPAGSTGAHGALFTADLNMDGKLDIVIPDAATNSLYIGLGNGNGTFTSSPSTPLDDSPLFVAIGDLDRDGIPDLVLVSMTSAGGGAIHVLLGNGDGTFAAQTPISISGDLLTNPALADFNHDGSQDLALYDVSTQQILVLGGKGDGTFQAAPVAALTIPGNLYKDLSSAGTLLTADLDGDGLPDIEFTGFSAAQFYHGNGDNTFVRHGGDGTYPSYTNGLFAADVIGNGRLGVAGITGADFGVEEFTNPYGLQEDFYSTPTVLSQPLAAAFPVIVFADFTGDGMPDVLQLNPPSVAASASFVAALNLDFVANSGPAVPLDSGVHNIVFDYSGDTFHSSSASAPIPINSSGVAYGSGFTGETGLTLNGSASLQSGVIQLTDGGQFESGGFFSSKRIDLSGQFETIFDFQLTNAAADGFAFVLQSNGPNALGSAGGGLGYGNPPGATGSSIPNSLAVAFDLYNNAGEGSNSVRLEINGVTSSRGVDVTSSGLDLHSGHRFRADITAQDTGLLGLNLTDLATNKAASMIFNLPSQYLLGGGTGYAGFTGATGASTAVETILDWTVRVATYSPEPPSLYPYPKPSFPDGFAGASGLAFKGVAAVSGPDLQLTNNTLFQATTAFAIAKVLPHGFFSTDFDFQIQGGVGDGFTFAIHDDHLGAIGSYGGGLGYGPGLPGDTGAAIGDGLAIKFDIHNNAGEGSNSTGLYLNGASPTSPAIDLTPSGISLSNGHTFHARIESTGTALTLSITDLTQYKVFTQTLYSGSDLQTLLPPQAFAGFTAGTGAVPSSIKILNWTWLAH